MGRFISDNFIPVKIHIKEQPKTFERFKALWTPTLLVMDADGVERHRLEGYLPVEDFLADLELGLAKLHFQKQQYQEAEKRYRSVYRAYPKSAAAPEACYWAGVSAYKATNKPEPLTEAAQALKEKYPESEWARKSSVWLH